MARGRKKLPAELLKLRGTDRKDRARPSSTIGDLVSVNEIGQRCQVSGLKAATERARDIYWSTCNKVASQGMLDPSFCSQILFYAIEYDIVLKCEADIKKNGMYIIVEGKKGTFVVPNPCVKQLHAALEKVLKIGSNFGFSPVDRQRLKIQTEDPKAKGIKAVFERLTVLDDSDDADEQ